MIRDLILQNDIKNNGILYQQCQRFDFEKLTRYYADELFEDLCDTLVETKSFCLSAPQIGIPYNVFVIGNWAQKSEIIGIYNPIVTNFSDEMKYDEETSANWPGLFVKVKRHEHVRVRYTTKNGVTDTTKFSGFTSMLFQQGYDQINGIPFFKKANRYHYELAKKYKKKLDKLRKENAA